VRQETRRDNRFGAVKESRDGTRMRMVPILRRVDLLIAFAVEVHGKTMKTWNGG
jgi:hypothetical protein